ncbi:MAG: PD-(D/E)XK nuclease family protein [Eubacterium sp.]|nr:PD-(D/E)XK nuclease family protein [Eubacterium sp.]
MGIEIITGRQGKRYPDKSREVYRQMGKALAAGEEKLLLIVPQDATLLAEQGLMDENGLEGLISAEVLSLERLGYRVFSEAGGLTRAFVDAHGVEMLLQKSVSEVAPELEVYKKSAAKLGFLDNICQFIGELKQNDIAPQDLETFLETMTGGRILEKKLRDILKIYSRFKENLGEERLDREDRAALVAEMIGQAEFLKGARIWIDGFESFSFLNFKIIEALARAAKSITMTLTCDINPTVGDASAFSVPLETLEWMRGIAGRTGQSFEVTTLSAGRGPQDALEALECQLFSYAPAAFGGNPETIEVVQRVNPWEETEACARKIAALVRDQGLSYGEIVVLAGDMKVYGSQIKRIFGAAGLPFFMDASVSITDNHFIEAVLAAMETVQRGFLYEDIFSFVKTGFAPISGKAAEDLENYVIEFGIKGQAWEKDFVRESVNPALALEEVNAAREAVAAPLLAFSKALKSAKTCEEKIRELFDFLEGIGVQARLEDYMALLRDAGDYETMGWYNQIWNILLEVFDQAAQTMGEVAMDLGTFIDILKGGLHSYTIGVIPQRRDVVEVTDLLRSRTRSMRALLVLGFNEGNIPSTGQTAGLLSEQERLRLKDKNFALQNSGSYIRAQEEFAIYNILARPRDYLWISYAMMDAEGGSLGLSPLLGRLKLVFPELKIHSALETEQGIPWELVSTPRGTLGAVMGYFRELRRGGSVDDERRQLWQSVGRWYRESEAYKADYAHIRRALDYGGVDDKMDPGRAIRLFKSPLNVSISRLEQYRRCPYAHYVHYGLAPSPRPEYRVETPDIGAVLHGVIDGVCKESARMGVAVKDLTPEQSDALVERLLGELLPQVKHQVFSSSGQYQYLGRRLNRVGKRTVQMLVKQLRQGSFDFKFSEQDFLREFSLPSGHHLRLKGIIDRLDLYIREQGKYVKVIDYKSGAKKINLGEIYYGLSLQLLVYMDAGLSLIPGEELIPGGTFYFHVNDPLVLVDQMDPEKITAEINKEFRLNGLYLDDPEVLTAINGDAGMPEVLSVRYADYKMSLEEFEALLAYVKGLVVEMGEKILGGDVAIRPYKKGQTTGCLYCDYRGICQFDASVGRAAYEVLDNKIKKKDLMRLIGEEKANAVD